MDGACDLPPEQGARVPGPVSAGKDAGAPEPPMAGQRGATFESVIWKKRSLLNGWGEQAVPSGGRNYRPYARAARGAAGVAGWATSRSPPSAPAPLPASAARST